MIIGVATEGEEVRERERERESRKTNLLELSSRRRRRATRAQQQRREKESILGGEQASLLGFQTLITYLNKGLTLNLNCT